eukprot:NODE_3_length_80033_cov_0.932970.p37 type:complete len:252 gc:universal NODE_3_length_80033_cov_0.932970:14092-13337(-)
MWYSFVFMFCLFLLFFVGVYCISLLQSSKAEKLENLEANLLVFSILWILVGSIVYQSTIPDSWFTILQGFIVIFTFSMHLVTVIARLTKQIFIDPKITKLDNCTLLIILLCSTVPTLTILSLIIRESDSWKIGNGFLLGDVSLEILGPFLQSVAIMSGFAIVYLVFLSVKYHDVKQKSKLKKEKLWHLLILNTYFLLFNIGTELCISDSSYDDGSQPLIILIVINIFYMILYFLKCILNYRKFEPSIDEFN